MPLALVISSFVAASQVGARPVAAALAARKIDCAIAPTILLGRHPGWGPPGGAAVPVETLRGMLQGIEAQGLFPLADAVLTGYFASPDQIEAAAGAIDQVRAANPKAIILADPIIGDEAEGLYVREQVAEAIARELVPRADWMTPNRFELAWLAGRPLESLADLIQAARALAPRSAITSVREPGQIGALLVEPDEAWLALAPESPAAPNGTGDLFAGTLLAALIERLPNPLALHRAVGVAADVAHKAALWRSPELPIVAAMDSFIAPAVPVSLRRL